MSDVKFGLNQVSNPTPKVWGRISTSLRYLCVSGITLISGTDFLPANKMKMFCFVLGGFILVLKAVDMGLGVSEPENNG
jgi:hypothetical protein